MIVGFHGYEHRQAEPELLRIEHRDTPLDHALRFEPLDALPAGRLRQPDAVGDLGDRERCVLLKQDEDLAVDGIHLAKGVL